MANDVFLPHAVEDLAGTAERWARIVDGFQDRRRVIGLSGASCCGKTWLANHLKQLRPEAVCLFDLDGYYRDFEYVATLEHRHDNPLSINFDDASMALARLMAGHEVEVPVYSFETHRRAGSRVCSPAPVIVVEGLFVFANERLTSEMDVRVWIEAGDARRLERRVARDCQERGREVQEILDRYTRDVTPGYEKFVQPLRAYADIIVENNGHDREAPHSLLNALLDHLEALRDKDG